MSNSMNTNSIKPKSSPCPANGRQTVGDGAYSSDNLPSSVIAVCHRQGADDIYYYSTTGGFDVPNAKCPPDRGSSDCVRGSPASTYASSAYSERSNSVSSSDSSQYFDPRRNLVYPPTPPGPKAERFFSSTAPQPIRGSKHVDFIHNLATPPLTPDDSFCDDKPVKQNGDALDLLTTLFPHDVMRALPFANRVTISSPEMGAAFDGVVLDLPGKSRTLYVDGKSAEIVSLRESIVALLDLADEHLDCSALVIALEKASPALGELLHSLMYVGGTVVTKPTFQVDPAYVLVGLEI
ncbi:hypothetical protein BV25DRAFT_1936070 [Artomyces pyxidatus]|uniref:Uncharacterized protein n=1 Tax=Artomyces pyxidatus TaxID=48021 RepID=A0ACB8T5A2_9AGAM|nr:hypothetical protein BV25DRAFT_1936070 [Artomyces pyxidatus]